MHQEACPVCGEVGGAGAACPLFPAWGNEIKVQYLFEQIKPRDRVEAEVFRFWSSAIEHYCKTQECVSFTQEDVMLAYKRRGVVTAMSIGRVLSEMRGKGDVMSVSESDDAAAAARGAVHLQQVASWVVRKLVVEPIGAVWSYVTEGDDDDDDDVGDDEGRSSGVVEVAGRQAYVPLLKELSSLLLASFASRLSVERTLSLSPHIADGSGDGGRKESGEEEDHAVCTFLGACRRAARGEGVAPSSSSSSSSSSRGDLARVLGNITEQDAMALAMYMVSSGVAVREGDVIKLTGPIVGKASGGVIIITEAEKKVLDFRIRVHKLERLLRERERQSLESKTRATSLHRQGMTSQARVELVRYKQMDGLVGKLRTAVMNLLTLHYTIEGVSSDVEIFAGLKTGSEALKQAKVESGLSVRTVDDAMLEAEELITEQREVAEALSQPLDTTTSSTEEEEAELYKELEALALEGAAGGEGESKRKKEEGVVEEELLEAPPPPITTITPAAVASMMPDVSKLPDLSGLGKKGEDERPPPPPPPPPQRTLASVPL